MAVTLYNTQQAEILRAKLLGSWNCFGHHVGYVGLYTDKGYVVKG